MDTKSKIDLSNPVVAAAMDANRIYRPGSFLGKVVLFKAGKVDHGDPSRGLLWTLDPYGIWQSSAPSGFELVEMDADHGSLIEEPSSS